MLSCHKGTLYRTLTLLGLVLAFVVNTHSGWALETSSDNVPLIVREDIGDANVQFPYLSPVQDQRDLLVNSFMIQMRLFGAINGSTGSGFQMDALKYLALTATMVGALILLFNAKNRKPPIVGAWLVLVMICIFAPYGSKLLFFPLSKADSKNHITSETIQHVESCTENPLYCGFTPQLAGIHVASILQLTFSDLFSSMKWIGLMDSVAATQNLRNTPLLRASVDWPERVSEFRNSCTASNDWNSLISYRLNNTSTTDAFVPQTVNSVLTRIQTAYKTGAKVKGVIYPPQAIVLYDKDEIASFSGETAKYWTQEQSNYLLGIQQMYQIYLEKPDARVSLNGVEGELLSLNQALQDLDANGFFEPYVSGWTSRQLAPGFFFVWDKATKNGGEDADNGTVRQCYTEALDSGNSLITTHPCGKLGNQVYVNHLGLLAGGEKASTPNPKWQKLVSLSSDSAVANMPVGVAHYSVADLTSDSSGKKSTIVDVNGSSPVVMCMEEGNRLIDEALNWTLGKSGNAPVLEKLRTLLVDKTPIASNVIQMDNVDNLVDEKYAICPVGIDATSVSCRKHRDAQLSLARSLVLGFLNEEQEAATKKGEALTDEERYRVLLGMVMDGVSYSSDLKNLVRSGAERQAEEDSQDVLVTGNSLVSAVGGWGAQFFGTLFTGIGAFFTGAAARAFVYFLAIFVDLALLSLIVLTPIMMLIALAMPGAAIGVLTISIMGAFILKAVPITLLILNNMGRLIYTSIGASASDHAVEMKNLIILGMAGLYINIIGMTFFLLFKMGDASAVLSRFTGLDNGANKLAEMGLNATKAATALAALPVFGAVGGAIGSRFGAAMAARAGASPELTNLVRGAQTMAEDKLKDGKGGFSTEEQKRIDDNAAGIQQAMKPVEEGGLGLSEQEANQLFGRNAVTDQHGRKFRMGADGQPIWESGGEDAGLVGATQIPLGGIGPTRSLSGPDVYEQEDIANAGKGAINQQLREDRLDADVQKVIEGTGNAGRSSQRRVDSALTEELSASVASEIEGNAQSDIESAGNSGRSDQARYVKNENGQKVIEVGQSKDASSPTDSGDKSATGGPAGAASGIAANVTVVGGKLDGVGTIDSFGEPKAAETQADKIADRVAEREVDAKASEVLAVKEQQRNMLASEDLSAEAKARAEKIDFSDPEAARRELRQIAKDDNFNMGAANARVMKSHNLNQQYAEAIDSMERTYAGQFASIAEKEKNGEKLTKFESYLKDTHKKILEQDPAGLVLGEQTKALANVERLQASLGARFGADQQPGFLKSMASGFYGGLAGGGGGLAKIPVIGTAVSEALNEFHQAPERARAWQAAGGMGSWWTAQGNAKRLGFYQKEMAPLAAGHQYEQMMMVGGFQAQADIARQAASEAVAKSRTQWEGMMAERKGAYMASNSTEVANIRTAVQNEITLDKVKLQNPTLDAKGIEELRQSQIELKFNEQVLANAFNKSPLAMTAVELSGLGRHEVAARLGSLRSEANVAQTASLKIETLKGGLNTDTMTMDSTKLSNFKTEKQDVFLTPDMLANMYGNLGVKGAAGRNDEFMASSYGLLEKQFLRGKAEWDSTRGMAFNREAAGRFSALDTDTDYLVAGHLKMVQGKEGHFDRLGQYQSLVKYRHESNQMVQDFVNQQFRNMSQDFKDAMGAAKIPSDASSASSWSVDQRAKVESIAKSEMKKIGKSIPLDSIFDVSKVSGAAKYEQKVMTAYYDEKSQAAENWVKMQKSAAAMYASALPDAKNFTRKMSIERNGVKYDIGSANMRLFEKLNTAAGKYQNQIDKAFMDYLSKNQGDIISEIDKKTGRASMRITAKGWAGALANVRQNAGQEAVDLLLKELGKKDGAMWKSGNDVEFGEIDADKGIER